VWPIYDLYRIASAVETRTPAALHRLVDIPSLRASLTKQILDAHRKQTDKLVALSERSERPAVGFGLAKILQAVARCACGALYGEQFWQRVADLAQLGLQRQ